MKKALAASIVTLCLAIPCKSLALAIPETSKSPAPAIIYSPKNTEILVFHGTVQPTENGNGTVLRTEKAVYPLLGGDFAMIIGEKVNIIGKMVREDNIEKIEVARVQFERE
ncbi:MAG: hypothetical protein KJ630_22310 [Proteobacteria bacterium]|nr:hypothetical protein [Pseudomonadota bacterium]